MNPKTGLVAQGIDKRANRPELAGSLGLNEHAEETDLGNPESLGHRPPTSFIDQEKIAVRFSSKRNGLRLTEIELETKTLDERTIHHLTRLDPRLLHDNVRARLPRTCGNDLIKHSPRNQHLVEEAVKDIEVTDYRKIDDR